jgi:hypothetical protein
VGNGIWKWSLVAAAVGFAFCGCVHVACLLGFTVASKLPPLSLEAGLVVVLALAIWARRQPGDASEPLKLSVIFAECPRWLRVPLVIIGCYGMLNFVSLAVAPRQRTARGWHIARSSEQRAISGYVMALYCVAFAAIYTANRKSRRAGQEDS